MSVVLEPLHPDDEITHVLTLAILQGRADPPRLTILALFSVSAFEQLASSVEEIAKRCFRDQLAWDGIAARQQARWNFGIPDFTGDTLAARGLRYVFVQSQIFGILHRRVFRPFLLTSAYDGHDDFGLEPCLSMVSGMIGRKSLRREAVWRKLTMRAIFASAYGRKATEVVATCVSREIMEKIQAITGANARPPLLQAIRSVAKAAVQVWRRARLEWDLIYSTMPSTTETDLDGSDADVMLWVRPHIVREELVSPTLRTASCVYLQGTAVRQDSPLVVARRQELLGVGSAGG